MAGALDLWTLTSCSAPRYVTAYRADTTNISPLVLFSVEGRVSMLLLGSMTYCSNNL